MERPVHKYHRPMAMARLLPYADRLNAVCHCDCFRRRSIQERGRSSLLPNGSHCLFVLCLACGDFCSYRAFILESPSKRVHGRWLVLVSVSPFSLNSLVVSCTLPLTSLSKSRLNSGMLTKALLMGHETKCERMREPDEFFYYPSICIVILRAREECEVSRLTGAANRFANWTLQLYG